MIDVQLVRYIAEEVSRQGDDPKAVYWMCEAWLEAKRARRRGEPLDARQIEKLGMLVTPKNASDGFRRCGVFVGGHTCPEWSKVPGLINELVREFVSLTPEQVYYRFQQIHPFRDGNGRVGKIVFNWLRDTLDSPAMPPNFFNCSNP